MRSVEVLSFEGCPNAEPARKLVEEIAADEGVPIDLCLIEVGSIAEAQTRRFLGSPSIRVDGRDVEPGADARNSFVFACRVYSTLDGLRGTPADEWIRSALRGSESADVDPES